MNFILLSANMETGRPGRSVCTPCAALVNLDHVVSIEPYDDRSNIVNTKEDIRTIIYVAGRDERYYDCRPMEWWLEKLKAMKATFTL